MSTATGQWVPGKCHYPTSLAFVSSKCRNKETCKVSIFPCALDSLTPSFTTQIAASPEVFPDETPPEACSGVSSMIMATGESLMLYVQVSIPDLFLADYECIPVTCVCLT